MFSTEIALFRSPTPARHSLGTHRPLQPGGHVDSLHFFTVPSLLQIQTPSSPPSLWQTTCCDPLLLFSATHFQQTTQIFSPNFPFCSPFCPSPQLQQTFSWNPSAKPIKEVSRPVKQVGELQISTFPLLIHIQPQLCSRQPVVNSPHSMPQFPRNYGDLGGAF